ncbi:MAG: YceI family protein [Phenylobacterium sp.]|uniref:YceI family protein n=1 Tax=Phenylobacterium sp. TaxID=1871053 RepID=UPI002735F732|nr:YceI family protein [Phenylobacterium sp.]MDP3176197.1 YceI family protein [Phenylobacterium sp.]
MSAASRTRSEHYAPIAILLHWLIAAAIILQVVLSSRMEGPRSPELFAVVQLHKSVGVTVLLLSLVRLGWRLANPPPPLPATMPRWERVLAAITHVGFYAVMIGMPLTGWIMVSTSRISLPTLLYGVVPWPHIPGLIGLTGDARHFWHELGEVGHDVIIKGFYVLLALHVAGALKHQLFSRDEPVLSRMAPGAKAGRWLEPRIAIIVAGVVAVIAFGMLVKPPLHVAAPAPKPAADVAEEPTTPESAAVATPAPVAATPAEEAAEPATPAEPVRWAVAKGSEIDFATNWGDTAIQGRFARFDADILFHPDALDRSKATVTIDLTSASTGDAQRDEMLPSSDWFDAGAHPKAVFTATRFEKSGEDRFVARGTLSLRGVTKPASLPFRLQIDGDKARVRGVTTLDRTAFGVGQGEWTSTDQIPASVKVSVDLRATRR